MQKLILQTNIFFKPNTHPHKSSEFTLLAKMYVKMKELSPFGGGREKLLYVHTPLTLSPEGKWQVV